MSVKLYGWAWGQRGISSTARLVLLALVERADNRKHECFPTQAQLAADTGLSAEVVGRRARELEGHGLLSRERRQRQDGSRTSDLYRLHTDVNLTDSPSPDSESPDSKSPDGESEPTRRRVTTTPTESQGQPDAESEQEEPITLPSQNPSPTHQDAGDGFDEFWDAYPIKSGRAPALKAWGKAITKAEPTDIIAGAHRYAEFIARQRPDYKVKWPQGWLNDERWTDNLPQAQPPALTRTNQTLLALAQEYRAQENDHAAIGSSSPHQPHRGIRSA